MSHPFFSNYVFLKFSPPKERPRPLLFSLPAKSLRLLSIKGRLEKIEALDRLQETIPTLLRKTHELFEKPGLLFEKRIRQLVRSSGTSSSEIGT